MRTLTSVGVLLLVAVCVLFASCDSFLERKPISQANVKNFYNDASDFKTAVNAAYAQLQTVGMYEHEYYKIAELRSDNTTLFTVGGGGDVAMQRLDAFSLLTTDDEAHHFWRSHYEGIMRCNTVIDRIQDVQMDQGLKDRFVGEVKFLRALMYFNLVRTFGGVPLILHEFENVFEAYDRGRASVDEVYQQVIADLEDAMQKLPISYSGDDDVGRATKGAAMSLLGKVYLTRKNFSAAAEKLKEVIDLGVYRLLPNYSALWDGSNSHNDEVIFAVHFASGLGGEGSSFGNDFCPQGSGDAVVEFGCLGFNQPTADIAEAYEPGDLRKDASMASGYVNEDGELVEARYITKYLGDPVVQGDSDDDWIVLRYADVLLMYAEALNEVGQTSAAYEPLNKVRERAGLDPLSALTQDQFRQAVYHERRVELAFEGHRWYALVRTGRAVEVMNSKVCDPSANPDCETVGPRDEIEEYQTLYPIPARQVTISPAMEQNPGY